MELSMSSIFHSSSSPDVLKKVFIPIQHQSSASIRLSGKVTQHLLCNFRSHSQNGSTIKVSCSSKSDVPLLEARCMDEVYDALAERLLPTAAVTSSPNAKYIVGLAGPPGAGKSTVASEVVQRVNKRWPQKAPKMDEQVESLDIATVLPMDGFHLYRWQLDAMEDPKEAHARRGAPWTFDPARLLKCLQTLRSQGSVYAPSFDHGVGDPVEDDIFVTLQLEIAKLVQVGRTKTFSGIVKSSYKLSTSAATIISMNPTEAGSGICKGHKVVVVEGNYLLLDEGIWKDISAMFDEKWFIDVDLDTSMERVLNRHITKSKKPPDVAKWRIEYNDRPNAEMIMKSKKNADLIIRSIEFSA